MGPPPGVVTCSNKTAAGTPQFKGAFRPAEPKGRGGTASPKHVWKDNRREARRTTHQRESAQRQTKYGLSLPRRPFGSENTALLRRKCENHCIWGNLFTLRAPGTVLCKKGGEHKAVIGTLRRNVALHKQCVWWTGGQREGSIRYVIGGAFTV